MKKIVGKWKITEMEQWDLDFIDAEGPGHFEFYEDNQGLFIFGYVEGDLRFKKSRSTNLRIEYTWSGNDEMDEVDGHGWFELINPNELYGMLYFNQGDESWVKAKRMK